jgi:hypothetical protein
MNVSPAVIYHIVKDRQPTLLLDEAQSIYRRVSESSEVIRELFNAGIDKHAKTSRMGGDNYKQIVDFSIYCPKVLALIGSLDGVLADRCLPIRLERKSDNDVVERLRSRLVAPEGQVIRDKIALFCDEYREQFVLIYDDLDPFRIENDRLAELLLPLQTILTVAGERYLDELRAYADGLEQSERDREASSPGIVLLRACWEIFQKVKTTDRGECFITTPDLIEMLKTRMEEPWAHYTRGREITPEAIAILLKPYGIIPQRLYIGNVLGAKVQVRGYVKQYFKTAWRRYLSGIRE